MKQNGNNMGTERHNEKSRTYGFGKVDYMGTGRRVNQVEIEVRLRDDEQGRPVFSAVGTVWNARRTDAEMCGQCMDEPVFSEAPHNKEILGEILTLWRKWHLNDGRCGTPAQYGCLDRMPEEYVEACEKEWEKEHPHGFFCRYDAERKWLEKEGMLEDEWDGEKVRYGEQFVYWPIDASDLGRIRELIDGKMK